MDQFKIHQINNSEDQYFAELWRIYAESFPLNERRTIEQQIAILNNSGYILISFIIGNLFIGFISFWTADEFIFIEHLAITPEYRNQGKGSAGLKSFIESNTIPVILEIELPVDDTTHGRLRFYESIGFKINHHKHSQPCYHNGDKPVPMKILSYPDIISDKSYKQFARFQKEIVMACSD